MQRLATTEGDVGAFAVTLFSLVASADPGERVDLRVVSPFRRLLRRGYVELLLTAGPRAVAFGVRHGVRTLADVRRLVRASRARGPFDWES